jgi:hypothetical protein
MASVSSRQRDYATNSLTLLDLFQRLASSPDGGDHLVACLVVHVHQRSRTDTRVNAWRSTSLRALKGEQVVDVMDRLLFQPDMPPEKIRADNVLCWEAAAATGQQVSLRRA